MMKSKSGKIILTSIMIALTIIIFLYGKKFLPSPNQGGQEIYKTYQKVIATIISQRGNGRIGKGQSTIWTVEFKDQKGNIQTASMDQSSFMSKDNGEEITIYYDPNNPTSILSEKQYDELTN